MFAILVRFPEKYPSSLVEIYLPQARNHMLSYQVYEQDEKEPFEADAYPDHLCHVLRETLSVLENFKQFNQPHSSHKSVKLGDPGHSD